MVSAPSEAEVQLPVGVAGSMAELDDMMTSEAIVEWKVEEEVL